MDLQKRGFNRLYQDGQVHEFSTPETLLDVDFAKPVYVLVDRMAISRRGEIAAGGFDGDLLSRRARRSDCANLSQIPTAAVGAA